jgi:hypothetical protein
MYEQVSQLWAAYLFLPFEEKKNLRLTGKLLCVLSNASTAKIGVTRLPLSSEAPRA